MAHKELNLWQFAAEKLAHQKPVMLLVVAESSGSSPGRQGFKMAVAEDEIAGSIGGGVMEVRLVEEARRKLASFEAGFRIAEQNHKLNAPNASGMICSGKQSVIFFRLDSSHLASVNEIIGSLESFQPKLLKITGGGFTIGPFSGEALDSGFSFSARSGDEFIYLEKTGFKNFLYIIGGGHCALALSEIMSKLDFHISLFDDRPNLNTIAKNHFAHRKEVISGYEEIGSLIAGGENAYAVVMTLGYRSDEMAIRQLFDKGFKYFGVLGSKAKMKTLLGSLEKDGFPKDRLQEIYTPIGIPINSHTPEEIAISIAAEIIGVKNS